MKKLFFLLLLIVSFVFLFNSGTIIYAKGCDDTEGLECGGWAKCEEIGSQDDCLVDCTWGYEYPYCNCKDTPEISECKCECEDGNPSDLTDGCAAQWCINLPSSHYVGGKCKSDKTKAPDCCEATESSCEDGIDNDCKEGTDCADTTDCPNGTPCGDNKECKDGSCVTKGPPTCAPTKCEYKTSVNCLCGTTEIDSGEYCCATLSKGYTIQTTCQAECCDNDGVKEAGEDCDGTDLGGETCVTLGYTGGTLACKSDCTFNTSGCTGAPSPPPPPPGVGITFQNPLEYETFEDLINAIMNFIFVLAIVALPLVIIVGAFQLLTSGGDPKKIETGKKIIFYALIGLAIILLARGIIAMIQQAIGVK